VSPTPRLALGVGACALLALLVGAAVAAGLALLLVGVAVGDALTARRAPRLRRTLAPVLLRGIPSPLSVEVLAGPARTVRVRQASVPDLRIAVPQGDGGLDTTVTATRRGHHVLPAVATRIRGPLGLGAWDHAGLGTAEVRVYPDLVNARRLAVAARESRRRDPGLRGRGPLGLGTEFERVREYVPDDDVRQVNWRATARVGRPMSNEHRYETERDVILCIDAGRLMAAPAGDRTLLDAAVDAASAVALVADELGDRCGVIAYDDRVLRHHPARRGSGQAVVEAIHDLEPSERDADPQRALALLTGTKRALVVVLTDLVEPVAARPLVAAVPIVARRHAVVVASTRDEAIHGRAYTPPEHPVDVLAQAVALDVLDARARAAAHLGAAGAVVIQAPADALAARCVDAYLTLKRRGRV
jgi:uncharacterized protein (DUF58 family)